MRKSVPGDHRNTPTEVIDAVRKFFGRIDLDPCSNRYSKVKATRNICRPKNGLKIEWGRQRVFVNPPWSNPIPWIHKAAFEASHNTAAVCLWLPVATDSRAGQAALSLCDSACFWKGRPNHPLKGKVGVGAKRGCMLLFFCKDHRLAETVARFNSMMSGHGAVLHRGPFTEPW